MKRIQRINIRVRKTRIILTDAVLLGLVFLIVVPDGMSNISASVYKLLYGYGYYIALFVTMVFFLASKRESRGLSKWFVITFIFITGTFAVALFHGTGFGNWFNSFSILLLVALLVESQRYKLERLMLTFLLVLEFWIYINLVLMILYPDGMYYLESNHTYYNWILGYKSSLQYYLLPALCFGWINKEYGGNKIRFYVLMAVSLYETLATGNAMLTVGMIMFLVSALFRLVEIEKIYNVRNYLIGVLSLNIIFVFYIVWFASTGIGTLFLDITGKSVVLAYRSSIIWPITLEQILEHLYFGKGVLSSDSRVTMYNGLKGAIHSHNQLMEILFIGGIFLMILYVILHVYMGKRLSESKSLTTSRILALAVFVFYIMMVVEVFTRKVAAAVWLLLFLACISKALHEQLINRYD